MKTLAEIIRQEAVRIGFSGVVSIQVDGFNHAEAFGYRDRANQIQNQISTRFGVASGTKGFTALGTVKLIEQDLIGFDTPVRSLLGRRLQNLHADITIRHLLGHTSGVADYLDEETTPNINEVTLSIPVQNLKSPADYLPMLEKAGPKFPPGQRFSYSNSGYVILALIIEIVSGRPYQDFIEREIFGRAGMHGSGFFWSDRLPDNTAIGYIPDGDSWRSNVFNLPIRGGGDGGAYSTIEDMQRFWSALRTGQLINDEIKREMLHAHSNCEEDKLHYGYGFWLNKDTEQVALEGYDAGVSFRSAVGLNSENGYTVISNTSSGTWSIVGVLNRYFQSL